MAFGRCHKRACYPDLGMLHRQPGGGHPQKWTDQRAKCDQAKDIGFLAQCHKGGTHLAVEGGPMNRTAASMRMAFAWKGEKPPNMPCLERTSPTAWPSLASIPNSTPRRVCPRGVSGGCSWDMTTHPIPASARMMPVICRALSTSPKNTQAMIEPKMGARLNSSVPSRGSTETRAWKRNASPSERPMIPERPSHIQRDDSAENDNGSRKRIVFNMTRQN